MNIWKPQENTTMETLFPDVSTGNKGSKGCEHKMICKNTMKKFFGSTPVDLI